MNERTTFEKNWNVSFGAMNHEHSKQGAINNGLINGIYSAKKKLELVKVAPKEKFSNYGLFSEEELAKCELVQNTQNYADKDPEIMDYLRDMYKYILTEYKDKKFTLRSGTKQPYFLPPQTELDAYTQCYIPLEQLPIIALGAGNLEQWEVFRNELAKFAKQTRENKKRNILTEFDTQEFIDEKGNKRIIKRMGFFPPIDFDRELEIELLQKIDPRVKNLAQFNKKSGKKARKTKLEKGLIKSDRPATEIKETKFAGSTAFLIFKFVRSWNKKTGWGRVRPHFYATIKTVYKDYLKRLLEEEYALLEIEQSTDPIATMKHTNAPEEVILQYHQEVIKSIEQSIRQTQIELTHTATITLKQVYRAYLYFLDKDNGREEKREYIRFNKKDFIAEILPHCTRIDKRYETQSIKLRPEAKEEFANFFTNFYTIFKLLCESGKVNGFQFLPCKIMTTKDARQFEEFKHLDNSFDMLIVIERPQDEKQCIYTKYPAFYNTIDLHLFEEVDDEEMQNMDATIRILNAPIGMETKQSIIKATEILKKL